MSFTQANGGHRAMPPTTDRPVLPPVQRHTTGSGSEYFPLHTRMDVDDLVARAGNRQADAAGDMAADMIGIDLGL